jgi:hypothetical protein
MHAPARRACRMQLLRPHPVASRTFRWVGAVGNDRWSSLLRQMCCSLALWRYLFYLNFSSAWLPQPDNISFEPSSVSRSSSRSPYRSGPQPALSELPGLRVSQFCPFSVTSFCLFSYCCLSAQPACKSACRQHGLLVVLRANSSALPVHGHAAYTYVLERGEDSKWSAYSQPSTFGRSTRPTLCVSKVTQMPIRTPSTPHSSPNPTISVTLSYQPATQT